MNTSILNYICVNNLLICFFLNDICMIHPQRLSWSHFTISHVLNILEIFVTEQFTNIFKYSGKILCCIRLIYTILVESFSFMFVVCLIVVRESCLYWYSLSKSLWWLKVAMSPKYIWTHWWRSWKFDAIFFA